jgi:hypothetical protein
MPSGTINNGLTVNPTTDRDRTAIFNVIEEFGYYSEYNSEYNLFQFPSEKIDSFEIELRRVFDEFGINATFSRY